MNKNYCSLYTQRLDDMMLMWKNVLYLTLAKPVILCVRVLNIVQIVKPLEPNLWYCSIYGKWNWLNLKHSLHPIGWQCQLKCNEWFSVFAVGLLTWWKQFNHHSFMGLNCYWCYRGFIKLPSAMPYIKTSQTHLPFSAWLDVKSQKCGLRHTVFSVSGNEYTGEWQDNKKHGEILCNVSFCWLLSHLWIPCYGSLHSFVTL